MFRQVYVTSVFSVVLVTQAFFDLLNKSQPRTVNSGMGSLILHNDPTWKY